MSAVIQSCDSDQLESVEYVSTILDMCSRDPHTEQQAILLRAMSGERYRSPQSIHYATAQATDSFSSDSESPMDMTKKRPMESMDETVAPYAYRNLFHNFDLQLPSEVSDRYCGCRVFVSDEIAYSGNAKSFQKAPNEGERALILRCNVRFAVTDASGAFVNQCDQCREYFQTKGYFKANPTATGKPFLARANKNISVNESGRITLSAKFMCCCKHHSVKTFDLNVYLRDASSDIDVCTVTFEISVKQWRKSTTPKFSFEVTMK